MDGALQSQGNSASTASREIDVLSVTKRLQRDGRWPEVEPVRDRLMKESKKKGMNKADAQAWTYSELDRLYPPFVTVWTTGSDDDELGSVDRGNVTGLGDIPASWGQLPPNASLGAEIAWCQANRLQCVTDVGDRSVVDVAVHSTR